MSADGDSASRWRRRCLAAEERALELEMKLRKTTARLTRVSRLHKDADGAASHYYAMRNYLESVLRSLAAHELGARSTRDEQDELMSRWMVMTDRRAARQRAKEKEIEWWQHWGFLPRPDSDD